MKTRLILLTVAVLALSTAAFAGGVTITIINGNAPNVGFNDPTPVAPVGGNPGTTLGQQRLNAFQYAANVWGATLDSKVDITILATFEPLTCTATSAVLGSAGATEIWSFSAGAPFIDTWYGFALANKLAGVNLDPANAQIRARFNSNLGTVGCLTGIGWYLGFDGNHGTQIDLVTVLEHEFAHGLGFQQFASVTTGAEILGLTDAYGRQLYDKTVGLTWDQMTDAQRAASAINPRKVIWTGEHVHTAVPTVLAQGFPILKVNSGVGLASSYDVGTASFGPVLSSPGVTGDVVLALDPADASGPTTFDACSALTNASAVAGKIAILDRGTCTFTVKTKNAQNAGAIAVLVADNAAGAPPAGLGGADPTITIPAVRVTQADGAAIKAALGSGTVNVTLGVDLSLRAGADSNDRALLYTPIPVAPGSTISHWDTSAFPNQLMEPAINSDLTHSVNVPQDTTLPLLRDVGWYPDADLDMVSDEGDDQCLGSDLTAGQILIGTCNTTVDNVLFSNGCTIRDLIKNAGTGVTNHGGFSSNIAHLGESLLDAGIITPAQKDALQSCAAKSK